MRVERHIPPYVERDPEPEDSADVGTLEDLLALGWVQHWMTDPTFDHWARTQGHNCQFLMAIHNDGAYWVAAYVQGGDLSSLPEWRSPQHG